MLDKVFGTLHSKEIKQNRIGLENFDILFIISIWDSKPRTDPN